MDDQVRELDHHPDSPIPRTLHHYTDIGGLYGILESQRLWGTHIAYLNDAKELEHGMTRLTLALTKWIRGEAAKVRPLGDVLPLVFDSEPPEMVDASAINMRYVNAVKTLLDELRTDGAALKNTFGTFITCLSKAHDHLGQWRGYGSSGGYAISFETDALQNSLTAVGVDGELLGQKPPSIIAVDYSTDIELAPPDVSTVLVEVEQEASRMLEHTLRFLDEHGEVPTSFTWAQLEKLYRDYRGPNPAINAALLVAAKVKHPAFVDEHEYRIITRGVEAFCSPSQLGLIPRVLHSFDPYAVKEIMIGPGEQSQIRRASIERYCVRNMAYRHVKVTESKVPFRNL